MKNGSQTRGKKTRRKRAPHTAQPRVKRRFAIERKLDALVKASIELAIVRHDLTCDHYALGSTLERDQLVKDVQEALRGDGTCHEGPAKEWKAFL